MQNRTRLPVPWMPPAAPESAIERTRSGAEQRARTTAVATLTAVQNGTYVCAREGDSLATSNPRFRRRLRHARPVDQASSGADLDLRPDRSDGAIWTACWS